MIYWTAGFDFASGKFRGDLISIMSIALYNAIDLVHINSL